MNSLWAMIVSFFESIGEAILAGLTKSFSAAISSVAENGGPVLMEIAYEAVVAVSSGALTNSEKREVAFEQIVQTLEEKGLPVVTNAVNIALEASYAEFKAKMAEAAAPAAGE